MGLSGSIITADLNNYGAVAERHKRGFARAISVSFRDMRAPDEAARSPFSNKVICKLPRLADFLGYSRPIELANDRRDRISRERIENRSHAALLFSAILSVSSST